MENDQDGITYTLTPFHLIYGRRITNSPISIHFEVTSTYETLTRKSMNHQHLLQQFTKTWRTDYLAKLRENHATRSKPQRHSCSTVSKGDIVIVKNDSSKRIFWKLAVVEDLLRGEDGNVRAAIIRVANSKGKPKKLRSSVKHLYPVEVQANLEDTVQQQQQTNETISNKDNSERQRREAAVAGELKRRMKEH